MKIITAIVQPFMLSKVSHALEEIEGFPGMTVANVRGFGREKSEHNEAAPHRAIEDFIEYVEKARIEIVAPDSMVEQITDVIVRTAHTGNRGDGKVFIWPVENAVRIQTGETDNAAL